MARLPTSIRFFGVFCVGALLVTPVLALDDGYCQGYGKAAVAQSLEYSDNHCTGGLGEWWNTTVSYHAGWCRTLPDGSPLPAKGIVDREAVLAACRMELGNAGRLVVHNNTDATLELSVTYRFDRSLKTLPVTVPPVGQAELVIYFGESELWATAINVKGGPQVSVPASVYSRAGREIELFPADFGTTFLSD